ncbi:hypothetical protein TNCV_4794031 [Trichonephila clavipes]|nr:hypothetical protein TNCV_4794031 [Trichonephila clavipes]
MRNKQLTLLYRHGYDPVGYYLDAQTWRGRTQDAVVAVVAEWYRYRIVACIVTSSSPVPLKTCRAGVQCTFNTSRAPVGVVC